MPNFQSAMTRADAVNLAKEYLQNNPSLKGGNLYELPDGTKLRVRKKEGGRLSAESYSTKTDADIKRSKGEQTYTTDEARKNAAKTRKLAREITSSTLHAHAHGARKTIAEHGLDIASGGIGDDQDSTSDPYFKDFKDSVAQKIRGKYGNKYLVDINEVTGYLRVIPSSHYNKNQNRSQQPGFDVEPDMDVDRVISVLPFVVAENLGITQTKFPGLTSLTQQLLRTPQQTGYQQPPLPGFTGIDRQPSVTAAPTPYVPPVVMQYSYDTYNGTNGNGTNGTNGNETNGTNGGTPPPTNGGSSNGGNGFVDGLTSTGSALATGAIAVGGGLLSLTGGLLNPSPY